MSVTAVSSKRKTKTAQSGGSTKRQGRKKVEPSEDDIRILAYSLYERRSADGIPGDAVTDWIEAERQLTQ